ncbi:MAG: membrane protein insertion efficiency factor YidD [Candidatus Dadabacteria bacterium]|nr:membrane protein insertion efficiency factor YidD [Candidatus Dadabacteria bacterium]
MIGKGLTAFAVLAIKIYKLFISPLLPKSCRFYPSCSCYAISAYNKHGLLKGSFYALKRVLRCHPFNSGGYDPVN